MAVDTSYLTTQVNNIVEQLHGIFDEIGVSAHERESREAEVSCFGCPGCLESMLIDMAVVQRVVGDLE